MPDWKCDCHFSSKNFYIQKAIHLSSVKLSQTALARSIVRQKLNQIAALNRSVNKISNILKNSHDEMK